MCKHALVAIWVDIVSQDIVGKTIKTVLVNILPRHQYQDFATRCVNLNHFPFMMIKHPIYAALRFPQNEIAVANWSFFTSYSGLAEGNSAKSSR